MKLLVGGSGSKQELYCRSGRQDAVASPGKERGTGSNCGRVVYPCLPGRCSIPRLVRADFISAMAIVIVHGQACLLQYMCPQALPGYNMVRLPLVDPPPES